ncbi:MAG: hypothetical protein K5842_07655 [Bacteroidales bacterium]|nr:hypothetical protein [Bacteroidales bacterium]
MKRFLVHILFFIIAAAMLYPPIVWLVGQSTLRANVKYVPHNYGHSDLRMEEADRLRLTEGPDLLFIGSSHCYRTFDTRVYDSCGYRSFNLGSSNQTPRQTYALLARYLQQWSPQLVVIEVHPDIMGNSGEESAIDIVSNTHIDAPIRDMALSQHNLCVFNTMCCSFFDQLIHRNKNTHRDSIRNVCTRSGDTSVTVDFAYVKGGFVEVTPFRYKPIPLASKAIEIRDDQLEWLGECLWLLNYHSTPYLLVEVPSTRGRYLSYTNHKEFEAKIRSLVDTDHEYLNLNEDRRLMSQLDDTTCFFDDDHLNQKGAIIFNKFFTQCILSD